MLPAPEAGRPRRGDTSIAEAFSQLAALSAHTDHSQYLKEVARICGRVIAPAAAISVTVGPPAHPIMLASDSKLAQGMDALQIQTGEGPCQEAWETGQIVVTNRLDEDDRWPDLARLAARPGRERAGRPRPRRRQARGFGQRVRHRARRLRRPRRTHGGLLASAVAAVIHQVSEHDRLTSLTGQLEEALTSRAVIDQAKGVIVARYGCDPEQAFQRLIRVSRNQNIKLREVARILVEQAQHPPRNAPGSQ